MNIQKYRFLSFSEKDEQASTPSVTNEVPADITEPSPAEELAAILDTLEPEPQAMLHSAEALEERYKQGYNDGYQQAQLEKEQEQANLETKIAETLESITINIALTLSQFTESNQQRSHDLANAAIAIAKKIAKPILQEYPLQEVEAIAEKCINLLYKEPHIDIIVHPSIADPLKEKVTTLLNSKGFKGEFTIRGNGTIAETDCRIEWQNGIAESNKQNMWDEMEKILDGMKK